MTREIPEKLYFKIGEVSKIAGVAPHVLRYWESEFNDIKPKRAGSGQRLYRHADVELILVIKDLLHNQGYTISGARKLIAESDDYHNLQVQDQPRDDIGSQLGSIKEELIELRDLLTETNKTHQSFTRKSKD